jgi:uncharacterized membrane protein
MKLAERLNRWQKSGLITEDQVKRILQYEHDSRPSYALYGFLGLGSTAIFTGIISIIAFNWDQIPDSVKLVADFLLLILNGAAIFYAVVTQRQMLSQIAIVIFLGLILGSIGLIGQVFHTGGELYEALLLWTSVTLPLVLITGRRLPVHLWYAGCTAMWTAYLSQDHLDDEYLILFAVAPAFFASLAFLSRFHDHFAVHGRAAIPWAGTLYAVGTIAASFFAGNETLSLSSSGLPVYTALLMSSLLPIGLSFAAPGLTIKQSFFFSLAAALYTLFLSPLFLLLHSSFLAAILFSAIWLGFAFFALASDHRRLFEFCLIGIGLRLLVVYFQVFGSLAATGIGLIVSGLLILASVWLYIRIREPLMKEISRWI